VFLIHRGLLVDNLQPTKTADRLSGSSAIVMSVIPGTITTNNGNAVAGSSKVRMKIDVTVGFVHPNSGVSVA
jgi:hypothetical protein